MTFSAISWNFKWSPEYTEKTAHQVLV